MKLYLNKVKLKNAKLLVLCYILLSFLHFNYIIYYDNFKYVSYYGNVTFNFVIERYIIGSLIISANIFFLSIIKVSDFLYSILVLILFFFVIPSAIIFSSGKFIFFQIFLLHNILFYSIYFFSFISWKFNFPRFKTKQSIFYLLGITVIGLIPFLIEYLPYINLKNLFLIEVYKTRSVVSANVNNLYTAYTYSWFSKIIIPVIIILCIYFKYYKILLLAIFFLIFLYLCGAHKMVFVGLFMLLIFYKYDYLKKTTYFLKFIVLLFILCFSLTWIFDYDYLWIISFRRVLSLSALLDYCYFDFFENNHIFWSDSIFSNIVDYHLELPPKKLISVKYFNRSDMNSNIGIISDGYKNAGFFGSVLNIILVSLYFSILNFLKISSKFFGLFVLLIFSFLNSSLTTILLTHGALLFLVICIFMLRETRLKMDKSI